MFASPLAFVLPPFESMVSGIVFLSVSLSGAIVIVFSKQAEARRNIAIERSKQDAAVAIERARADAEIRIIQARADAQISVIQNRTVADGKG